VFAVAHGRPFRPSGAEMLRVMPLAQCSIISHGVDGTSSRNSEHRDQLAITDTGESLESTLDQRRADLDHCKTL